MLAAVERSGIELRARHPIALQQRQLRVAPNLGRFPLPIFVYRRKRHAWREKWTQRPTTKARKNAPSQAAAADAGTGSGGPTRWTSRCSTATRRYPIQWTRSL